MLNVRVKKALLTILTACLTVLMTIGAVLGFTPTPQPVKADTVKQFTKVTVAPADWSGTYLIVYENGKDGFAFNGALTKLDATNNCVSVTIEGGVIAYNDDLNSRTFTIAKSGSNYTIKSASNKYVGNNSNSNALPDSSSALNNTITIESGSAKITSSGGSILRFNSNSDQKRFRYYASGKYTNQKAIHLYRLEDVGGSGSETPVCKHENMDKTVNSDSVTYNCTECDYSYIAHTITFNVPQGIIPDAVDVEAGKTAQLPTADNYGNYTFAGWAKAAFEKVQTSAPELYKAGEDYTMGDDNVTLYAVYAYSETTEVAAYKLVTDVSDLAVGNTVVIAASGYNYALSTTQNNNNRGQATVTKAGDTITFGDNVQLITLEEGTVAGTFAFNVGNGYLYAAGANSSNQLKTKGELDNNGSWKIEINSKGVATIKAQNEKEKNWLRYNPTNNTGNLFSCYGSGQADVCLYKKVGSGNTYYVTDTTPTMVSANLTLGKELVMNYKVIMHEDNEAAKMTFTMNGVENTVVGTKEGHVYVYSLAIDPQYMGENIAAELKLNPDDDEPLASKAEYSVKAYAESLLNDEKSSAALKQLVSDLLHYGAAAQNYYGEKTENKPSAEDLVTYNVENILDSKYAPTKEDEYKLITEESESNNYLVYFKSAGVNFSSDNKIFVKLSRYDEKVTLTVTVNGNEVGLGDAIVGPNGEIYYYTKGLLATEFDNTFTFVLSYDGVVMQTLTYSVNAYAYAFKDSTNTAMAKLAIALYNYGKSAEAYVA